MQLSFNILQQKSSGSECPIELSDKSYYDGSEIYCIASSVHFEVYYSLGIKDTRACNSAMNCSVTYMRLS